MVILKYKHKEEDFAIFGYQNTKTQVTFMLGYWQRYYRSIKYQITKTESQSSYICIEQAKISARKITETPSVIGELCPHNSSEVENILNWKCI